ncbi:ephexin-1 [Protopterus annectens]|uniref:ephexin-1 n=1 Tax=Protopterus annectens TaxID=7888 RepID=UPI001CFAF36D|nr:ephexin-1 [Protopterus annectens]
MTGRRRNELEMTRHLKGGSTQQTNTTEDVHSEKDSSHHDHMTDGDHETRHIPIRRNSVYYRSMRRKKNNKAQQRTPAKESSGVSKEHTSENQNTDSNHSIHAGKAEQLESSVSSNPPPPVRSALISNAHRHQAHQKNDGSATDPHSRITSSRTEAERNAHKHGGRQQQYASSVHHVNQHRLQVYETVDPKSSADKANCIQTLEDGFATSCVVLDHLEDKNLANDDDITDRASCNTDLSQTVHKLSPVGHVEPLPVIHPADGDALKALLDKGFLYQEYWDKSTLKAIEDRRIQDSMNADTSKKTDRDSTAGKIIPVGNREERRSRLLNGTRSGFTLWQELQEIRNSGVLNHLSPEEIKLQEAMFELITSEASYNKSLELLVSHFMKNESLCQKINQSESHFLFSNILDVMTVSHRFLLDLEQRLEENIIISDVCDIVYEYATKHFEVYVIYVSNQTYQERTYRTLLQDNASFGEVVSRLEKDPRCKGLPLSSFLILPFQRITRLKLLVQSILKKVEEGSEKEAIALKAYQELESIVRTCNEKVKNMSRTEYLINIEKKLEFKTKSVPVISHSRWLVKQGDLQRFSGAKASLTLRKQKLFKHIYLFLFNDLLLVTHKTASDKYLVLDSAVRDVLRIEDHEDQGQQLANTFTLRILENQDLQEVNYVIKAASNGEKKRWMIALAPFQRERYLPTAHQLDFPQVQCVYPFVAQEPDELSLDPADVLAVLDQSNDGWTYGERLHDRERGWFKSSVVEIIQNPKIRAQNLRECYRVHSRSEVGDLKRMKKKKMGSRDYIQ